MGDRPETLHVELHDDVVAHLRERRRSGRIELTHTERALERWEARLPVVSCSLPVSPRPQDATPFLDGLLPEGHTRTALAAQRDLRAADTWGLLASFGRDIAGALVIRDPEAAPARHEPHVVPYDTTQDLAAAIEALPDHPLGVQEDSELSLAGLQDKLLLVATDSGTGWGRSAGGLPSTHICKPDPLTHPGVVEREAEALRLARAVGLTSIDPQLIDVDGRTCLVVDRYDRVIVDGSVERVHQEDLLQATGHDPTARRGLIKYQSEGGPGFREAAALLIERAADPEAELRALVGAMVFTVLVGDSDAHAKNLSLLLDPPGTVRLAPRYDTVPTMLFGRLRVRCAMWIGGVHRSLEDVARADLIREIAGRRAWKVPDAQAARWVDDWVQRIADAADTSATGAYVRQRAASLSTGG